MFNEVKWDSYFNHPWEEVYDTIKKMPVTNDYKLEWKSADTKSLADFLIKEHDFSEQRVKSALEKLEKEGKEKQQKSLGDF